MNQYIGIHAMRTWKWWPKPNIQKWPSINLSFNGIGIQGWWKWIPNHHTRNSIPKKVKVSRTPPPYFLPSFLTLYPSTITSLINVSWISFEHEFLCDLIQTNIALWVVQSLELKMRLSIPSCHLKTQVPCHQSINDLTTNYKYGGENGQARLCWIDL